MFDFKIFQFAFLEVAAGGYHFQLVNTLLHKKCFAWFRVPRFAGSNCSLPISLMHSPTPSIFKLRMFVSVQTLMLLLGKEYLSVQTVALRMFYSFCWYLTQFFSYFPLWDIEINKWINPHLGLGSRPWRHQLARHRICSPNRDIFVLRTVFFSSPTRFSLHGAQ